jgi:hypothetical protein
MMNGTPQNGGHDLPATAGQSPTTERRTDMARAKVNRGMDSETARQVISMAVGAAEALVMRIGHLAKRAIAETARAAEEAGTELGAALARITPPARKVATSADSRVPKAVAKARVRRHRRRGVA